MTTNLDMQARWQKVMQPNYGLPQISLERGQGAYVWDVEGKRYVDFLAGIATNLLGHAHPAVSAAVIDQVQRLGHVSNFFAHEPGLALAERLLEMVGRDGRVFFCNSGAEANEAAFKIARLTGRPEIIAAENAFHGRTMGALALTGQPGKRAPFEPMPQGVVHVPFGDISALRAALSEKTAMVLIEAIQGEAGVVLPPPGYLRDVRRVTEELGVLLAIDEVQTGMGRTGEWFAHQREGIEPDLITMAKGLGAGLPLGGIVAFGEAASLLTAGLHGSTFGGNPICCAASLAAIDAIAEGGLLEHAAKVGDDLHALLLTIESTHIREVRGAGLLRAVEFTSPIAAVVQSELLQRGFISNAAQPNVLRIAPPLVISREDVEAFVNELRAVLSLVEAAS
jgi:acetylornithine/N-succinyldiaminopimelate aminotransferase